jgi:hypothetical protein
MLFSNFPESLDALNQGTGIGLCLCKDLVNLLEGSLWLDEKYASGFRDCPGTRLVIDIDVTVVQKINEDRKLPNQHQRTFLPTSPSTAPQLPSSPSELISGDDQSNQMHEVAKSVLTSTDVPPSISLENAPR